MFLLLISHFHLCTGLLLCEHLSHVFGIRSPKVLRIIDVLPVPGMLFVSEKDILLIISMEKKMHGNVIVAFLPPPPIPPLPPPPLPAKCRLTVRCFGHVRVRKN